MVLENATILLEGRISPHRVLIGDQACPPRVLESNLDIELFARLKYDKQTQSDGILMEKREQEDDSQGRSEFEGPEYECFPAPMLSSERPVLGRSRASPRFSQTCSSVRSIDGTRQAHGKGSNLPSSSYSLGNPCSVTESPLSFRIEAKEEVMSRILVERKVAQEEDLHGVLGLPGGVGYECPPLHRIGTSRQQPETREYKFEEMFAGVTPHLNQPFVFDSSDNGPETENVAVPELPPNEGGEQEEAKYASRGQRGISSAFQEVYYDSGNIGKFPFKHQNYVPDGVRDLFDQNQLSMRPGRQLIVSDSIHLDSPTVNIAQDSVASNYIGHGIPSNLTSESGDKDLAHGGDSGGGRDSVRELVDDGLVDNDMVAETSGSAEELIAPPVTRSNLDRKLAVENSEVSSYPVRSEAEADDRETDVGQPLDGGESVRSDACVGDLREPYDQHPRWSRSRAGSDKILAVGRESGVASHLRDRGPMVHVESGGGRDGVREILDDGSVNKDTVAEISGSVQKLIGPPVTYSNFDRKLAVENSEVSPYPLCSEAGADVRETDGGEPLDGRGPVRSEVCVEDPQDLYDPYPSCSRLDNKILDAGRESGVPLYLRDRDIICPGIVMQPMVRGAAFLKSLLLYTVLSTLILSTLKGNLHSNDKITQNGDKYCLPEGLKFYDLRLDSEELELNTVLRSHDVVLLLRNLTLHFSERTQGNYTVPDLTSDRTFRIMTLKERMMEPEMDKLVETITYVVIIFSVIFLTVAVAVILETVILLVLYYLRASLKKYCWHERADLALQHSRDTELGIMRSPSTRSDSAGPFIESSDGSHVISAEEVSGADKELSDDSAADSADQGPL